LHYLENLRHDHDSPAKMEGYDNPDGYEDNARREEERKDKKQKRNAALQAHCTGKRK